MSRLAGIERERRLRARRLLVLRRLPRLACLPLIGSYAASVGEPARANQCVAVLIGLRQRFRAWTASRVVIGCSCRFGSRRPRLSLATRGSRFAIVRGFRIVPDDGGSGIVPGDGSS